MNDELNKENQGEKTVQTNTRPGFLTATDKQKKQEAAAQSLKNMDKSAEGEDFSSGKKSGVNSALDAENKTGLYKGSGKIALAKKVTKGKFSLKEHLVEIFVGLVLMIFGVAGIFFGVQSFQLVAWKENISNLLDKNSAVIVKRSNFFVKKMLSSDRQTTKSNILGTKFSISPEMREKLKARNIDYAEVNGTDGKKVKILVYSDSDGKVTPIVASNNDKGRVGTSYTDADGKKVNFTDGAMTLDNAKANYTNFRISYGAATIDYTGRTAGWFDKTTDILLKRIGGKNPRNKTSVLTNESTEEDAKKLLYENNSKGASGTDMKVKSDDNVEMQSDEAGTEEIAKENDSLGVGDTDAESVKSKLTARAKKAAAVGGSTGCMILRSAGAISSAVGAIRMSNAISYALTYLEAADKIKAGDANNGINLIANELNNPTDVDVYDIDGKKITKSNSTTESAGFNAAFADSNIIDENDPSALAVNREYAMKSALIGDGSSNFISGLSDIVSGAAGFGAGVAAFKACNHIQLVAGVIDGVSDLALFFTTVGTGNVVKAFAKTILKGIKYAAVTAALQVIISVMTPIVAAWLGESLENVIAGDVGGYAMYAGAHAVMDGNLQMSTGKYASKEEATQLYAMANDASKEWAKYERATLSPFDVTSEYTFLGNIVSSAMPVLTALNGGSVSSVAISSAGLISESLIGLMGDSAIAAKNVEDHIISLASDENCLNLSSVGVAGDFACNKYSGAYISELEKIDPVEVYEELEKRGSFVNDDEGDNPAIKKDSDYAKYIIACVASDTQPGEMNAAVEGYIEELTTTDNEVANGLINFGSNFVPFSGFLDAVDAKEQEANLPWNSGMACTGNSGDASIDEAVKYYSMYNLDQRVMADMGLIEESSTVAFLEDYYEENPIDNSLEGIIAQYGGFSKDDAELVLGQIEYLNFIANYDASDRYAFGEPVVDEGNAVEFDNENVLAGEFILQNKIVYADVRNRVFTV